MNSDRAQLSIAVLFSVAVHGVIVLFGDFFAGQGAIATNSMPIAVTIAAAKEVGVEIPKPSPQESDSDVVEPAKTKILVPANVTPEHVPPIQSSTDRPPTPNLEPEQAQPAQAVAPASAQQSPETALVHELTGSSHTNTIAQIPMPESPDVAAMPLYHLIPKPVYPSRSRDLGEEGRVIIAVLVGEDGRVLEAYISESSGYALLDGSALATVTERWRFKPGMLGGTAVPSWVRVPIKFSIKGS